MPFKMEKKNNEKSGTRFLTLSIVKPYIKTRLLRQRAYIGNGKEFWRMFQKSKKGNG